MKQILCLLTVFSISAMASAKTWTVKIDGMMCGECIARIEGKLCKMPGVTKCDVSVGQAILETDAKAQVDNKVVSDLVAAAGHFKVTNLSSTK